MALGGPKTTNGVRNLASPCGATALQQEQCCSATKIKLTNSLHLLMGSDGTSFAIMALTRSATDAQRAGSVGGGGRAGGCLGLRCREAMMAWAIRQLRSCAASSCSGVSHHMAPLNSSWSISISLSTSYPVYHDLSAETVYPFRGLG